MRHLHAHLSPQASTWGRLAHLGHREQGLPAKTATWKMLTEGDTRPLGAHGGAQRQRPERRQLPRLRERLVLVGALPTFGRPGLCRCEEAESSSSCVSCLSSHATRQRRLVASLAVQPGPSCALSPAHEGLTGGNH